MISITTGQIQATIKFTDIQSIQYMQNAILTAIQHLSSTGNPSEFYQDCIYNLSNLLEEISFNGAQMELLDDVIKDGISKNKIPFITAFHPQKK